MARITPKSFRMVVWPRRTFLRQKKLQSTEGRSVTDVRTLNLLLRRLTRGPIRTHKTPETDPGKIIYPLGQDRSVKRPRADGLWKWTFVAQRGDNSVYVHGNFKTLFFIFSQRSDERNPRTHAALASGRPQKGATAARKACLLKNPAARCKKAANLPALVAASPCSP